MNISINISDGNRDAILAEAMQAISGAAAGEPEWKRDRIYGSMESECDISETAALEVFRALIAKYPKLRILAMDAEEIREEDSSAQWWRSTTIKTVCRPDGTTELVRDCGTYWA